MKMTRRQWIGIGIVSAIVIGIEVCLQVGERRRPAMDGCPEEVRSEAEIGDGVKGDRVKGDRVTGEEAKAVTGEGRKEAGGEGRGGERVWMVDVNRADTMELQMIQGIGRYSARKIVQYREQLGGYADIEQIREIEGLSAETVDSALVHLMVREGDTIQKIEVNRWGVSQLQRHPYIRFSQAKAIYEYRRRRVRIEGMDEIEELGVFDEEEIEKVRRYMAF